MRFALYLLALTFGIAEIQPAERAGSYLNKPDDWFRSEEGKAIIENIIAWQTPEGSWPKNASTTVPTQAAPQKGTFDNGATTDELRLLAHAFSTAKDPASREAFLKGLDHILRAQYPTGGWPQFHPPGNGYHRHVTFNDGSMARLMNFVRDVATKPEFQFVDADRREACTRAFDRGVECILKSQIRANGALTAWCAQHDEVTFEPRPARTFELVSLSGAESVGILELLMNIEKPSPNVVAAVDAGVAWFEAVQIKGFRETKVNGDKRLVPDPDAPPLWARFYEIGTNRPIFSGRDGVKRYAYSEIEAERRNGYAWYGTWARNLPKKHEQWKKRITP
ncbi:MAG: pectate lyase [Limisphaerales bacterium]